MHIVRKRKLVRVLFMLATLIVVTLLVLYALRQNISLFYTPTQVCTGAAPVGTNIRIGGMVVRGSLIHGKKDLFVQFLVTDYKHSVAVLYRGVLPDLFREGQGIVATGKLSVAKQFMADNVLAKHDENYMPPEVKDAVAAGKEGAP